MHLNFDWSTGQIIWTLTFAAHLVLLVVLLGRDRVKRFLWFTVAIALVSLRLIASRLLFNRLPQLTLGEIFVTLADVSVIVSLLVLVELARRIFLRAQRKLWTIWTVVLFAIAGTVVASWGKWPAWKTLTPMTKMVFLGLMQLFAQKGGLLNDVLTVTFGILVVSFGWRYGAGWRSHAQRIVIGLTPASLSQLAVQIIWQIVVTTAKHPSMAERQRLIDLHDKLFNAD